MQQQWFTMENREKMELAEARSSALWREEGLPELEVVMRRLATGGAVDRLGQIVTEHLESGGKRIRARLALAAAETLGVARGRVVGWAAACELLHNATLIHDDVQDGDRVRRGHPTTWVRHGVPQAINAGDLMLMLPFLAVSDVEEPAGVRAALLEAVAAHAAETVRGQSLETELAQLPGSLREAWRRAALGKTGALMALPVRGAALMAGLSAEESAALGGLFARLGVVFQLQDDVLDLYGDKGRGEVGCDLQEGKFSALVVAHLDRAPGDETWLRGVLAADRGAVSAAEVSEVARRFREAGTLDDVLGEIRRETVEVLGDPRMEAHPGLRRLARDLVVMSCAPIASLLGPWLRESGEGVRDITLVALV